MIEKYLEKIQSEETSVMTFHMDSPHKTKKPIKGYDYPEKKKKKMIEQKKFEASRHKNRIMIDFDGVIHNYNNGWQDGIIYGDLIEGAKETIDQLRKRFEIVIFTTRAAKPEHDWRSQEERIKMVAEWLDKHDIYYDQITAEKLGAFAYIDDKAIRFKDWKSVRMKIVEIDKEKTE